MKQYILIWSTIFLSSISYGQEVFYSDNFSKKVTELNSSMKSIGFSTILPTDYKKYDDIVAVVDNEDVGIDDFYTLNFYYNLTPTKLVGSDRKVKYVLETGTDNRSDFTSIFRSDLDESFNIFFSINNEKRTYRYQTIAIKVMGRQKNGMHWVNDEYVQKYNYVELSFSEIKLDLGDPVPTFTTKNGLFTYQKYVEGKAFTEIFANEDQGDISVRYKYGDESEDAMSFAMYEIKAGEVKQQVADMSGGAPTASKTASVSEMKSEIKLNLKKTLIKSASYNDARSVKLQGQRINLTKVQRGIYQPYMIDGEQKKSNSGTNALGSLKSIGKQFVKPKTGGDKYNKFINDPQSDLNWQTVSFGNSSCEMLELDFYHYDQCNNSSSSKSMTLKEGEEGKVQKVILILCEIGDKLYVGSFTKEGKSDMNEEDLKFKDYIFSTFQINS